MERGEGVINVVFVCCEEKTEGEITGYEKQDALSQPRQKRQNLRDVFFVAREPAACDGPTADEEVCERLSSLLKTLSVRVHSVFN